MMLPGVQHQSGEASDAMALETRSPQRWLRFSLRAMLLLFIPIAILLAIYSYRLRQEKMAIHAHQMMLKKRVTAKFLKGYEDTHYSFIKANITNQDLDSFIPAFNGCNLHQWPNVTLLKLNGSKVSPEAIERFRKAVPQCKVEP